jgi:hypothetical protein
VTRPLSDQLSTTEILLRDKYHCTATVMPREVRAGLFIPREPRRCSIVGSEMVVRDGRAVCPRHAHEIDRLETDETEVDRG